MKKYCMNYYDSSRSWEDQHPGWHEVVVTLHSHYSDVELTAENVHQDIVEWLYENIDNVERHARWERASLFYFRMKFRYERDYICAVLRWL